MMRSFDADVLVRTLSERLGHSQFRPGQENVSRAAFGGRDVLCVMPTGSGKSLCYQLPTLARGGTALVISPLIALMEDQVGKLIAAGCVAERIHSGRTREQSRAAAIAYRDNQLQFLFIAPERLSVPGFSEFLAKRKPSLIAIDEAHCISQWGHDFRPDYRMLSRYIPLLRPAPVVALTATATPVVQSDIVQQLALQNPVLSIQGFRRKNIAVEVVEVAPNARRELVTTLLRHRANRPAIVYVPTRSEADSLASDLRPEFRSEPYHAGLSADLRNSVQTRFLQGSTDVIIATIAFGMGIDKPDVRTVIHTALPGSVESYYQEIGRAGRDGEPCRAILMHSYADRHRHDFFFNRDYPEVKVLESIHALLQSKPIPKAELQRRMGADEDTFDKALEKLWLHGGAAIDPEENVSLGNGQWRASYLGQGEQRSAQLDAMLRYAGSDECRMAALIRHFGDRTDTKSWCGICDFCSPESCVAQQYRDASFSENRIGLRVMERLTADYAMSTGKLYSEICSHSELTRDEFEELLAAMGRAGLVTLAQASFEKDGRTVPYRTVRLTEEGEEVDREEPLPIRLKDRQNRGGAPARVRKTSKAKAPVANPSPVADKLTSELRAWRLAEAKSKGLPAFRIFTDKVLQQIAEDQPLSEQDLLAISGIGPSLVKRYGAAILAITSSV